MMTARRQEEYCQYVPFFYLDGVSSVVDVQNSLNCLRMWTLFCIYGFFSIKRLNKNIIDKPVIIISGLSNSFHVF